MQTDIADHPPKSVPSLWYVTILRLPKYLKWLKQQKSIVSDSGGKKLETKVSAALVSSEGCKKKISSLSPLLFWWFVRNLWHSFPVVKNRPPNAGNAGDTDSIPRSGRSPGGGNGNLLQGSFFFFNWRLITLQHCGGFSHTLT